MCIQFLNATNSSQPRPDAWKPHHWEWYLWGSASGRQRWQYYTRHLGLLNGLDHEWFQFFGAKRFYASHLGEGPINDDERWLIEQGYHRRYVLRSELNNMSELGPIHLVYQYVSKRIRSLEAHKNVTVYRCTFAIAHSFRVFNTYAPFKYLYVSIYNYLFYLWKSSLWFLSSSMA